MSDIVEFLKTLTGKPSYPDLVKNPFDSPVPSPGRRMRARPPAPSAGRRLMMRIAASALTLSLSTLISAAAFAQVAAPPALPPAPVPEDARAIGR